MTPLLRKEFRDGRRALIGWSVGLAAMVLMYSSFWPSVRDNAGRFEEYLQNLPDALRNVVGELSLGTAVGYLQSELFSFLGPALILAFAIGAGARSIAGEEEQRTIDLVLAAPIDRRRLVLEKFASILLVALGIGVALWLAVATIGRAFGLDVSSANMAAATLHLVLLGIAFGSIAMMFGCWWGRRSLAIAVTASLAVGTFLLDAFAPAVDGAEWVAQLTPFYYYGESLPLRNGLELGHAAVLLAIAAVALIGAVVAFDRRDVGT
jgi:ABC-2 type transport system permease protein